MEQSKVPLGGVWLWARPTRDLDEYFLVRHGTQALPPSPSEMGLPEPVAAGGDGGWREMEVPGNWQSRGLDSYSGALWFARRLTIPEGRPRPAERAWLRFSGADYFCVAWVNGRLVGTHEGYFQPFEFDVTDALVPAGDNSLLVLVSSPAEPPGERWPNRKRLVKGIFGHHDCRPGAWDPEKGQSKNTGGIWGEVELILRGPVWVDRCHVDPVLTQDGEAKLVVRSRIRSLLVRPATACMRLTVTGPGTSRDAGSQGSAAARGAVAALEERVVLQPGGADVTSVVRLRDPKLWWPWDQGDQPIYELGLQVSGSDGSDLCAHCERFGVREFRMDPDKTCRINGRRMFLRGTNIIPTQWLGEYGPDAIARDVALLKDAGLNVVRVHAHVNRHEFYDACDGAGILVWQDAPLQWSYDESDQVYVAAARQVEDMVSLLFNHPSVVAWCCHNEPSTNRYSLDPALHRVAGRMDASRSVFAASDFHDHPYPGWYYGSFQEFSGLPGAPFPTEFGAQGLPCRQTMEEMMSPERLWPPDWATWAYHDFQHDQTFNVARVAMGGSLDEFIRNSQDYQAALVKSAVECYRRAKYDRVKGFFHFMFVDCWPAVTWAVVDHARRPKKAYGALALACQPLLVSICTGRRRYPAGGSVGAAVWVVNDLPREFNSVRLAVSLESPSCNKVLFTLAERTGFTVPADSAQAVMEERPGGPDWRIPADLSPGIYHLRAVLYGSAGEELSRNHEEIEVVAVPSL